MSGWPWKTPEATRRALADLIHEYPEDRRPTKLREVAFRRLLARLFQSSPESWVLKGGVALLLRLDPNRSSDDIDLAFVAAEGEHAVALERLMADARLDLGDFFSFVVGPPRTGIVDPDAEPLEVPVTALLGTKEWARFSVDLAPPRADAEAEELTYLTPLTGSAQVDDVPGVRALPVTQHLADKVCAVFERHGEERGVSSRARDLVDIAMIAGQVSGIDADELTAAIRAEEDRRTLTGTLSKPLPKVFALDAAQEQDWRGRWGRLTKHVSLPFDDALTLAGLFLDPILSGEASGRLWEKASRSWVL